MAISASGAVQSIGALHQCTQVGAGGFKSGVGQWVLEGVADEIAVASDAGDDGDELRDTGMRGSRQPPGQQLASLATLTRNTWRSGSLSGYAR
jgi:hypothetical protein